MKSATSASFLAVNSSASEESVAVRFPATVLGESYQGALVRYRLSVGGQEIIAERQNRAGNQRFSPGASVTVGWDPARSEALVA